MRLISQDGITDITYENSVLNVFANYGYNKEKHFNEIIGYRIIVYAGDNCLDLGDYSTKEKALKVMKEIREAYKECLIDNSADPYYYIPQDNEVKE